MKRHYVDVLQICLVLSGCTHGGMDESQRTSRSPIDSFFHEHFGEATELHSDSLVIKDLGVTVYSIHALASHGTDFRLVSDDRTGGIFAVPIYRDYFIQFLPPALILSSLSGSDELVIANSIELGLEAFMNQASRLSNAPMTYDQLDSILTFTSNTGFNRIRSEAGLDSVYSMITQGAERSDEQGEILNLLRNKLQARQILLYNYSDDCLEAFIIEASMPVSNRNGGKHPLQLNNVIRCLVGFDKAS